MRHNPIYLNIPFIGEVFIEYPSQTYGRRFVDGIVNPGGVEVWLGRFHVVLDKPKNTAVARYGAVAAIVMVLMSPEGLGTKAWNKASSILFGVDELVIPPAGAAVPTHSCYRPGVETIPG